MQTTEGRPALLHWYESHQPALLAIPLNVAHLLPLVVSDIGNEHPSFEIPEVTEVKARLNLTKSKLDAIFSDPEGGKVFDKLLTDLDLYRDLRHRLRREFNGQNVSNAWLKLIEILAHFDLVRPAEGSKELKHFDNCALPGAFLFALCHHMATHCPHLKYTWWASSLVPERYLPVDQVTERYLQFNALGDEYGLFAANRERWLMQMAPDADGCQLTGDMTKLKCVLELERQLSLPGKVDLYTSDLGVSAKSDFNRQEELNAQPHLGQDLAGLLTLTPGGNFIVKHYTLFEPFSYTLALVLGTLFEEFFICKPMTSRPTNSECYFVGQGFLGLPPRIRDALQCRLQDFSMRPLLSLAIVQEMDRPQCLHRPGSHGPSGLLAAVKLLWTHQSEYLEETVNLYHTAGHSALKNLGTYTSLEKLKQQREEDFISTNRIKPMHSSSKLRTQANSAWANRNCEHQRTPAMQVPHKGIRREHQASWRHSSTAHHESDLEVLHSPPQRRTGSAPSFFPWRSPSARAGTTSSAWHVSTSPSGNWRPSTTGRHTQNGTASRNSWRRFSQDHDSSTPSPHAGLRLSPPEDLKADNAPSWRKL